MKKNNDNTVRFFFKLLRFGLWGSSEDVSEAERKSESIVPEGGEIKALNLTEDLDWKQLYRLVCEQTVAGYVAVGLEQYVAEMKQNQSDRNASRPTVPENVIQAFKKIKFSIGLSNYRMNDFLANIIRELEAAGIEPLLLKGQGVAQNYLSPEVRQAGDIDLLLHGEDYEKIMGLEIGADDYIVKPFSPGEIIARINAILRRITPKNDDSEKIFSFDNLEIDLNNFTVKINNEIISLTKKEIEILWTLATNQNKVFTRENLLDLIWGFDYFGESRTVDTHIKRLRAKLDNYEHKKWNIKTIWGVGYKFDIL